MAIVDQYGNPVHSQRRFASGANRTGGSSPTIPVYDGDFSKLVPNLDRKVIVGASRAIFQDYGPITGAAIQKANNTVGRAWNPQFKGKSQEWGALVTDWLVNQWFGSCDVRGRAWDFKTLLWLDSIALDRDGDFLTLLTDTDSGYPLTQRIPVNRIGQRSGDKDGDLVEDGVGKGGRIIQGVIIDRAGRPIAYRILGDDKSQDVDMPANRVVHSFDPLWHDQVRGLPSYSGAIKAVFGSMTAHEREQMNQNIRSSIALVEYNEHGGPDVDDVGTSFGAVESGSSDAKPTVEYYTGGMIKYFRSNSGGKLDSVQNNQPGDMWDRFQDRVIRMACAGMAWPYELVWKGSEINAALVRNIQERARASVEDRQDVLRNPALFTIRYAIRKAIKIGIIPECPDPSEWWKWDFQMPGKFSIDAGRDAQARREDYKLGLRNRTEIHEEQGKDPEAEENARIAEVIRRERKIDEAVEAYRQETGREIDRRLFYQLGANDPAPEQTPTPTPSDED
jgi:capsid protein